MSFLITASGNMGCTQIPNDILLHYIMRASGDYVKVYLFLVMASQNPGITGQVSVDTLADRMELSERDIIRILRYWEREGLLSLIGSGDSIDGITMTTPGERDEAVVPTRFPRDEEDVTPHLHILDRERKRNPVPERIEYTPSQIDALAKDAEMQQTLSSVEASLGAPISPAHMQLVMYLMCDLGFAGDLIAYLYSLAAKRRKTTPRYIETIAIEWSKKGIQSVAEAREEAADHSGKYRPVKQAFGIHRDLAPAEKEIIDGWDRFSFSDEIIAEACRRTVIQTGDTSLQYAAKILEGWHKQGVKTMQDITRSDEAFHNKQNKKVRSINGRGRPAKNSFQNFSGRDYSDEDYENMERALLKR